MTYEAFRTHPLLRLRRSEDNTMEARPRRGCKAENDRLYWHAVGVLGLYIERHSRQALTYALRKLSKRLCVGASCGPEGRAGKHGRGTG